MLCFWCLFHLLKSLDKFVRGIFCGCLLHDLLTLKKRYRCVVLFSIGACVLDSRFICFLFVCCGCLFVFCVCCVCLFLCCIICRLYRCVVLLSISPGVLDNLQLGLVEAHKTQVQTGEETRLKIILLLMVIVMMRSRRMMMMRRRRMIMRMMRMMVWSRLIRPRFRPEKRPDWRGYCCER